MLRAVLAVRLLAALRPASLRPVNHRLAGRQRRGQARVCLKLAASTATKLVALLVHLPHPLRSRGMSTRLVLALISRR